MIDNYDSVKFMLALGDDNLMLSTKMLKTEHIKKYIKQNFNIVCKAQQLTNGGEFCGLIVY